MFHVGTTEKLLKMHDFLKLQNNIINNASSKLPGLQKENPNPELIDPIYLDLSKNV